MMRKIKIKTKHGEIVTPFFMPDATRGVLKGLSVESIKKAGIQAMVVNTYHLYLEPGLEVIKSMGGIHQFMNWSGPLLSDSGGFQVFSLIHRNKSMGQILDDKVIFKSPINGSRHELTPEKSIQIQFDLGVDMMVCLDDCPPNSASESEINQAVKHTIDWAKRCKIEYNNQIKLRKIKKSDRPLLFGVIQGGEYLDLRKKCTEALVKIDFDGYGYGAMPVDKDGKLLIEVLKYTAQLIPKNIFVIN
ncbi:MAG: tRNA guanosine(34) transglycosylase Tgt [Candidatus Falkowbacteria bacterium]|nr:tRNA guanosine(34) transglycosylase Tgt [Candidatus Falkowbacteria bacterium]